ncbi:hypothetical protein [Paracoccus methylarcula]|uniref:hypothetical protein n=1 Tax=Paracoccus methylarcula TaxID=72022 RepID=UPI001B878189|nr:hypothetical protein [Paracoccus methylarcula]
MPVSLQESARTPIVSVENVSVDFDGEEGSFRAIRNLSFSFAPGETLAVVGESGSDKSTTGRSM